MKKSEMLDQLIAHYTDGNKSKFASLLGVKPQTISAWLARDTFDVELIYSKCRDVNAKWLITGEGKMLKNSQSVDADAPINYSCRNDNPINSPVIVDENPFCCYLLPISSRGGSLTGFAAEGITQENCERVISPIAGVDFAIGVSGDSMYPEFPSGSQVLIKKIDPNIFIEWGRAYVLDTPNGVILKEVHECENKDCIICHSINPDPKFADFTIKKKEIWGMYRVLMCLSAK